MSAKDPTIATRSRRYRQRLKARAAMGATAPPPSAAGEQEAPGRSAEPAACWLRALLLLGPSMLDMALEAVAALEAQRSMGSNRLDLDAGSRRILRLQRTAQPLAAAGSPGAGGTTVQHGRRIAAELVPHLAAGDAIIPMLARLLG